MSSQRDVPTWQMGLAVVGTLLWFVSMPASETIRVQGWLGFYKFVSGYILGFIVAFAGFVFWEFVHGRGRHLLDPHPFFRWFSYLSLAVTMLFGLAALYAEIFGNTDWRYNIGSLLGGTVVVGGLLPVIEKHDRSQPQQAVPADGPASRGRRLNLSVRTSPNIKCHFRCWLLCCVE